MKNKLQELVCASADDAVVFGAKILGKYIYHLLILVLLIMVWFASRHVKGEIQLLIMNVDEGKTRNTKN